MFRFCLIAAVVSAGSVSAQCQQQQRRAAPADVILGVPARYEYRAAPVAYAGPPVVVGVPYGARIAPGVYATPSGRPPAPGIFSVPNAPFPADGPFRRGARRFFGFD